MVVLNNTKFNQGFTLVELAIVIVIIGLLVGGVLQGKELVDQAKVRNVISNVESYKSAIISFKGKYNCIPGDCNNHALFFGSIGITEGDASGQINLTTEAFEIWRVLGLSKFIKGTYPGYTNITITKQKLPTENDISYRHICVNSNSAIFSNSTIYGQQTCFIIASTISAQGMSMMAIGNAIFSVEDTRNLDLKLDDENPSRGDFLASRQTSSTSCTGNDAFSSSVTSASYVLTDTIGCVPYFIFNP